MIIVSAMEFFLNGLFRKFRSYADSVSQYTFLPVQLKKFSRSPIKWDCNWFLNWSFSADLYLWWMWLFIFLLGNPNPPCLLPPSERFEHDESMAGREASLHGIRILSTRNARRPHQVCSLVNSWNFPLRLKFSLDKGFLDSMHTSNVIFFLKL